MVSKIPATCITIIERLYLPASDVSTVMGSLNGPIPTLVWAAMEIV